MGILSAPPKVQPAAQAEAIRRALQAGRHEEAYERLCTLKQEFPAYHSAQLNYEVECVVAKGLPARPAYAAWGWTRQSPYSVPAWEALADATYPAYQALSLLALRELKRINGEVLGEELEPPSADVAGMSIQHAIGIDLCKIAMAIGDYDEAEGYISHISLPLVYMHRALICFARGQLDQAINFVKQRLAAMPDDASAAARFFQFELWRSGAKAAQPYADLLDQSLPLTAEHILAKMTMQLFAGRYQEAEACYQEASGVPWSSQFAMARFSYLGACSAWNLGLSEIMQDRLKIVQECGWSLPAEFLELINASSEQVEALQQSDKLTWILGHVEYWWPVGWLHLASCVPADWPESQMPHPDYLHCMLKADNTRASQIAQHLLFATEKNNNN